MPLYVSLINWTDQGIRNAKDTIQRAEAFSAAAERMNCKVHTLLWTMGQHDIVSIIEAPDDATASTLTLAVGMQGNVRTVTMRAYTADEMGKIIGGLP